jgi:hypothetical protein
MLQNITAEQLKEYMRQKFDDKPFKPEAPKSVKDALDDMIAKLGVKHYVLMGGDKTCNINESIGTNGLGGCTCVVGFKDNSVFLAHYATPFHDTLNYAINTFNPQKLFVFAAGKYSKIDDKWVLCFPDINIGAKFNPTNIPYSTHRQASFLGEDSIFDDAVIVRDGKIRAFNRIIEYQ